MSQTQLVIAGAFFASLLNFMIFLIPFWRRLYEESNVNVSKVIVGLWMRCYSLNSHGATWTCDLFNDDVTTDLKIKRAAVIVAVFCSINSVLFILNPLNSYVKDARWENFNLNCGMAMLLVSGLLTGMCCIWECVQIMQVDGQIDWFDQARIHRLKYQPGVCVFVGLLVSIVQLALAVALVLQKCKTPKVDYTEGEFI